MLARTEQERISRDEDFPAWVLDQAKALRLHKPRAIDWEALADQLDDMYSQVEVDLQSDLRVILQHLLKLQFQPGDNELKRRARGWKVSATEHRNRVSFFLGRAPSLRKKLSEFVQSAYKGARKEAALHMNLEDRALPPKCPWTIDQVIDLDFFPERAPSSNGHRR
jgi:Domain of unknown function DUF29